MGAGSTWGALMLPTPPGAASPSPASLSLQNPEVPQCLAHETRRKPLAGCSYTKEGVQDPVTPVPTLPFPVHSCHEQNEATNPNQAKFCHEKLPEPKGSGPFPPQGALTSVKAALM